MKVFNRRLRRDYQVLEKIEAGIALTGAEVKSIRQGRIKLDEAFVRIQEGEAFLYNAQISPYGPAKGPEASLTRPRKLLLHRREILALEQKAKQKRLTLIPVSCYTRGRNLKIEIALAKGKREFEKRQVLKKKEMEREVEKELKGLK